ncbi:hypothetical protein [Nocardia brasiliensis]|uniref:hypothetical protein n=1 Tax=Nocardia brasiliensis TaxID=37326 RepID=UPI00245423FE|nr:hypothetical protein [Nocardia brasiliensis]
MHLYEVPRNELPGTQPCVEHRGVFDAVIAAAAAGVQRDGIHPVYEGSDRPREVVRLVAHALRIHLAAPDARVPAWARGSASRMGLLHDDTAVAIDSIDPVRRRALGMRLISGLRGSSGDPAATPVRLLGNWLIGQNMAGAAGGMARWMSHKLKPYQGDLVQAWWLIHGERLVQTLDEPLRDTALIRRWEAGGITADTLADLAGLSVAELEVRLRPTLNHAARA